MSMPGPRPILVTGFDAFPGVVTNPSAAVARGVEGREVHGIPIVGRVLPVRWRVGPEQAIAWARELDARLVIGLGVAAARVEPEVETIAVAEVDGRPDANGEALDLPRGPASVLATIDAATFARAMGFATSADAGKYVCNAWLYQVSIALAGTPVGFVHMPIAGIEVDVLLRGLAALTAR
jgi:pyrrolidone-carboxylate peptidase